MAELQAALEASGVGGSELKALLAQLQAPSCPEANVLKLIGPLFLDDLRAELEQLRARQDARRLTRLVQFHMRLSQLRLLDPACGRGEFLAVTYRELRRLEIALLREIHRESEPRLDVATLSKLDVAQCFGIERDELSVRVAGAALWLTDRLMDDELARAFGQTHACMSLEAIPQLVHADGLDIDWNDVLPAKDCSWVLGRPPFGAAAYQSEAQRAQVRAVARLGGADGAFDYAAAWFLRAGEYVQDGTARIGFVAPSSIAQGEQVARLWPLLFERSSLEIDFAHRPFAWESVARTKASAQVVIVGLSARDRARSQKRLFTYESVTSEPTESVHARLSPYLFDASHLLDEHLVVREVGAWLSNAPRAVIGSKPIDGGHYIFDAVQRAAFLRDEPRAEPYLHPYVGAEEFIHGGDRWILAPFEIPLRDISGMSAVLNRVTAVRKFRMASKSKATHELGNDPARYQAAVVPNVPFLVIPKVSSERQDYVPIGWLKPPVIPSALLFVVKGASLWDFGVLTSRMHMVWLQEIGGRHHGHYRYSIGTVYNTFPWPEASEAQRAQLEALAQRVLEVRAQSPDASLGELYDAATMKSELRRAHVELDAEVERLYSASGFESDRKRVEHLFGLYEKLLMPQPRAAASRSTGASFPIR